MNSRGVRNPWRRALIALGSLALGVLLSASAAHRPPQPPPPQPREPRTETVAASELVLQLDPAHSTLHYTVDTTLHTVHGTFALKNGSIHLDPASGKASGEIVADATSGDSGNGSRDKKMHKEVLESARYTEIIFRPDRVEGNLLPRGRSTVHVHGIFLLHGAEHEMTVPVDADFAGTQWTGAAKFDVPYINWGLKNPSTFLLKVNPAVNIDLDISGSLQNPTASK